MRVYQEVAANFAVNLRHGGTVVCFSHEQSGLTLAEGSSGILALKFACAQTMLPELTCCPQSKRVCTLGSLKCREVKEVTVGSHLALREPSIRKPAFSQKMYK